MWPDGTRSADDAAVITVGEHRIDLGDTFRGGGGFVSPPYLDTLPDIPADCIAAADTDEVMWVQSVDEGTPAK